MWFYLGKSEGTTNDKAVATDDCCCSENKSPENNTTNEEREIKNINPPTNDKKQNRSRSRGRRGRR